MRYAQVLFEEDIESLLKKDEQNDKRLLQLLNNSDESIPKLQANKFIIIYWFNLTIYFSVENCK